MYVNGRLVKNNVWTKTHKTLAPIDIIGGTGFTGLIDEVKVYNRVLTEAEINKALLTKKNFYNYEENASYRSCSIRCYELRQQVLRQKVLPGHLLPSGHRRGS